MTDDGSYFSGRVVTKMTLTKVGQSFFLSFEDEFEELDLTPLLKGGVDLESVKQVFLTQN